MVKAAAPDPVPEVAAGSPDGKPGGSDYGVVDGVEDGLPGGRRGGRIGGAPWGDGDEIVAYDLSPRLLRQYRPAYPADAALQRIEGTVVVDLWIGRDGKVHDARVVQSIPLLDAEAVRTVRRWEFTPALKRGAAVPSIVRADVKFTIL
jgi:periplasmic protein TonB